MRQRVGLYICIDYSIDLLDIDIDFMCSFA